MKVVILYGRQINVVYTAAEDRQRVRGQQSEVNISYFKPSSIKLGRKIIAQQQLKIDSDRAINRKLMHSSAVIIIISMSLIITTLQSAKALVIQTSRHYSRPSIISIPTSCQRRISAKHSCQSLSTTTRLYATNNSENISITNNDDAQYRKYYNIKGNGENKAQ